MSHSGSRYLSATGVAEYLSVSRTTVQKLTESGKLPKPIYLSPRMPRWDRAEIDKAVADGTVTSGNYIDPDTLVEEACREIDAAKRRPRRKARG